ncbi:hypothetical protein B6U91_00530 [Candidatus Pacearchaeota archaeon ex4484_71]|nr:MAG: hypothetical protein B6U91_00530 [Candidatus Pacearchaeota archaeon ex4484_71]
MKKRINFEFRGKKISLEAKKVGFLSEGWGLMFSRREKANALLFEFKKPTMLKFTSFFVFYPFIMVWVDEVGKVVEVRRVNPFKFSILPKRKFTKVIEIPINKRYSHILKLLDED